MCDATLLEARFGAALNAAPDAMVLVDTAGTVLLANSGAEELFGYARAELVGNPVEVLVPEALRHAHTVSRVLYGESPRRRPMGSRRELRARRGDGTEFPVEISLSPVEVEGHLLVMAAVRDITARLQLTREMAEQSAAAELLARHAEEVARMNAEIRALNAELEARVAARTHALEAANRELEGFTHSVSHDLRAPIRHIDGFARLLAEQYGPDLDAKGQRYVQRIRDGARHMGHLVDDLLGLARVGKQPLRPRRVALETVVSEVVLGLKPDIAARDIQWIIGPLPTVECDSGLMRIVFANLLGNAVKYTRPRRPAVIEVGQASQAADQTIFVRDNGVGFDMKYADQLFGVFQRLHPEDEFEGTGIGLATVQRIVHRHGGDIWAEAAPDRGATFYLRLPRASDLLCA